MTKARSLSGNVDSSLDKAILDCLELVFVRLSMGPKVGGMTRIELAESIDHVVDIGLDVDRAHPCKGIRLTPHTRRRK